MEILSFSINLLVCILVVTIATMYLRSSTGAVIIELCKTQAAAEFWLKSVDIMAYSGALMLVLIFGSLHMENLIAELRLTLILTLAGIFITVLFVSTYVWGIVSRKPGASS